MKNYEAIQQTLQELNNQIEALQEQGIKEHRAKLEQEQAKQYTFDEASLIGFIESIKEEAINKLCRAIEREDVAFDSDCADLSLEGNTIEVEIDGYQIAQNIIDYCEDEEIVDTEEALLDAKRHYTIDSKTKTNS